MDPDSPALVFIEPKEIVDDFLSIQKEEDDSATKQEEFFSSPLIGSEWPEEVSQIDPSMPPQLEDVIDVDSVSCKFPAEPNIITTKQTYDPQEKIVVDISETSTQKDEALIYEPVANTLNEKLENFSETRPSTPTQSEDGIDTNPISYNFPNAPSIIPTKEKILVDVPAEASLPKDETLFHEPDMNTLNEKHVELSQTIPLASEEAIRAKPISFFSTQKSMSKSRKRTRTFEEDYSDNWICKTKPRNNGTKAYDKYYYLKTNEKIKCRSLKEIERYEETVIRGECKVKGEQKKNTEEVVKKIGDIEVKKKRRETENMRTDIEKFLADANYYRSHVFDGQQQPPRDDVLNLHREIVPYQPSDPTSDIIDLNPSLIETLQVPAENYVNSPPPDLFAYTNAPEVIILEEVVEDVFEKSRIGRLEHSIHQMQREQKILRDSISVEIAEATRDMNQGIQRILAYLNPPNPQPWRESSSISRSRHIINSSDNSIADFRSLVQCLEVECFKSKDRIEVAAKELQKVIRVVKDMPEIQENTLSLEHEVPIDNGCNVQNPLPSKTEGGPEKSKGVEVTKRHRRCRFPNCGRTDHDSRNCPNKKKNMEPLPSETPNK